MSEFKPLAHQRPPRHPFRVWLISGPRGAGTSRAGSEFMAVKMHNTTDAKLMLIGSEYTWMRDLMFYGPNGIHTLSPQHDRPMLRASSVGFKWPDERRHGSMSNGSEQSMRGYAPDYIWWDDPKPNEGHLLHNILGVGVKETTQVVITGNLNRPGSLFDSINLMLQNGNPRLYRLSIASETNE